MSSDDLKRVTKRIAHEIVERNEQMRQQDARTLFHVVGETRRDLHETRQAVEQATGGVPALWQRK